MYVVFICSCLKIKKNSFRVTKGKWESCVKETFGPHPRAGSGGQEDEP